MIVSHQLKCIFFKTRKTAGTSLEIALSEHCGPDDIITKITPEDEEMRITLGFRPAQNYYIQFSRLSRSEQFKVLRSFKRKPFYNHMKACDAIRYLDKKVWENYYKFTIERNPFDKMISRSYWLGFKDEKQINDFVRQNAYRYSDFDLYSIDNRIVVDRVFRYESLDEDMKELSQVLGLKKPIDLNTITAKAGYRKVRDYRAILNDESRDVIEKAFAREIAYFKYNW